MSACRIGSYHLGARLGHDTGNASVHHTEQLEPVRRQVVLKMLRPGMESWQAASFEFERETVFRMDHPNIVQAYDSGTTDEGLPFFVMEFVPGASLVRFCDRRALSLTPRIRLLAQVCRGAQHAHERGIVHRDLKPDNVMVAAGDGEPVAKIIDFGVAAVLGGEHAGGVAGTPGYMAPEVVDGGRVDARTDVYTLGALLYRLITGRQKHYPDPAPPSTVVTSPALRQQLCGDLDRIALQALELDPARRYQSASDLAADLEQLIADGGRNN